MRVFITGMGGELGTRIATLLEADPAVEAIVGVDLDPPRRRLDRAEFHLIDPRDRHRTAEVVRTFEPTAMLHLGVYEPYARSSPTSAIERTSNGTIVALGTAAEAGSLDRVVVRSGVEVYGRRRGAPRCPSEDTPPDPTSPFGHSLLYVERIAREMAYEIAAPVSLLRLAPLVGPHSPSPLGRFLRLPAVPFSPIGDPPFAVLHQEDAARAIIAALHDPYDGPVNVAGPGTVTASQAARLGARLPVPVIGPLWRTARVLAELSGSPLPEHVHELLLRGRCVDASSTMERLGIAPQFSTHDVIEQLYEWADVDYLQVGKPV
jgi:UDP-glucose 4-epimerase